jgi:hypothetical protein
VSTSRASNQNALAGIVARFLSAFFPVFLFFPFWSLPGARAKKVCRHGKRGFNALRFPLMCRRFAVAVRGCGVALGCAAMASADLMRCDFLLYVGDSRLRFAVARCAWLRGDGKRGFNALRFPLMCRRFAVAVQSQAQAAFLPGIFNQSSGAQVETYASHRPIDGQFQVGKPAGKFSARQAELGLAPKPAGSESE